MTYQRHLASVRAQLAIVPGRERLVTLAGAEALDDAVVGAILEAAARFSAGVLAPLNTAMDRDGARLVEGRVRTATGHRAAWDAFVAGGWPTLDLPVAAGGQGLPNLLATACEDLFARGSAAFGMLPTPTRSAAKLLESFSAGPATDAWIGHLVAGEWGGTICISEAEAGSDLARITTCAEPTSDGAWSITGEKMWISFGDHDLTPRIGHVVLARVAGAPGGTRGLSLFLVPDRLDDGARNGVVVRRVEEKLGLHGSPTCALGFEGARGLLVGEAGRGLPQLFRMITLMRLSVGTQGVGIATGASEAALSYARGRTQGGGADGRPAAIIAHADVRRQLLAMAARTEVLRGLLYAAALQADLEERETGAEAKADALALLQWLLPIVKNFGAETGFEVAAAAVLVFGGAGYTREWPVEQALRDARVFAVYEGTTGMQALDLLHRRLWRDGARGLGMFTAGARTLCAAADEASALSATLDRLDEARAMLAACEARPREGEAVAVAWLNLCTLAATGWIALRLVTLTGNTPTGRRLAACGRFWLADLPARAAAELAVVRLGERRVDGFDDYAAEA